MEQKTPGIQMQVTLQEKKLLELLRTIDYGELRVVINASKPVRVEEIRKSLQL